MEGIPYRSAGDRVAAEAFFRDRPAARATFEAVRAFLARLGPMEIAATSSRVAFLARTRFLWAHGAHRDGSITVGFLLPHRVASPRLRTGEAGSRWGHHAKVHALDDELEAWFREAYAWDSAGTGKGGRSGP